MTAADKDTTVEDISAAVSDALEPDAARSTGRLYQLLGSRAVRLFSSSILDQVLLSGGNFVVGLLLFRFTPEADYGTYVLALATLALLANVQSSYVSGPLAVIGGKHSQDESNAMIGAIEGSLRPLLRILLGIALAGVLVAALTGVVDRRTAITLSATALAGWVAVRRDYLRNALLMNGQPQVILRHDVAYVACCVAAAVAAIMLPMPAFWAVLGIAAGGLVFSTTTRSWFGRTYGWIRGPAGPTWRLIHPLAIWSSVGSVTSWSFTWGSNYLLAHQLDVSAVAAVNGSRLLIMPMIVMLVGVKSLLLPMAAQWLRDKGLQVMVGRLGGVAGALVVMCATYAAVMWLIHRWVMVDLLKKHIPGLDALILLGVLVSMLSMVRDVFQTALLSRERYRVMTFLTAVVAITAIGVMTWAIGRYGAVGVLVGQACGETISLLGVVVLVILELRRTR